MESGTVKWFSLRKGRGFIKPDNGKHYVLVGVDVIHKAGLPDLREGQRILFEIDQDRWMDWARARTLALLGPSSPKENQVEWRGTISAAPARDWTQTSTHLSESRSFSPPISMWLWSALSVLLPRLSEERQTEADRQDRRIARIGASFAPSGSSAGRLSSRHDSRALATPSSQ
jgi:CspA family cold shock protein